MRTSVSAPLAVLWGLLSAINVNSQASAQQVQATRSRNTAHVVSAGVKMVPLHSARASFLRVPAHRIHASQVAHAGLRVVELNQEQAAIALSQSAHKLVAYPIAYRGPRSQPLVASGDGDPVLTSSIEQYETADGTTFDAEWLFPTTGYASANDPNKAPTRLFMVPNSSYATTLAPYNTVYASYLKTGGNPMIVGGTILNEGVTISEVDVWGGIYDATVSLARPVIGVVNITIVDGVSAGEGIGAGSIAQTAGGNEAIYTVYLDDLYPSDENYCGLKVHQITLSDPAVLSAIDPNTGEVGNCAVVVSLDADSFPNSPTTAWWMPIGASNGVNVLGEEVPTLLADPTVAPSATATPSSDTCPPGTYYVGYAYVSDDGGETLVSPLTEAALTSNGSITVSIPAADVPAGVSRINYYAGMSPTAIYLQGTLLPGSEGTEYTAVMSVPVDETNGPPTSNVAFSGYAETGLVTAGGANGEGTPTTGTAAPAFDLSPSDANNTGTTSSPPSNSDYGIAPYNFFIQLCGKAADNSTALSRGKLTGNIRRQGIFVPGTGSTPEGYAAQYNFQFYQTGTTNLIMTQQFIAQPSYDSTGTLTPFNFIIDGIPAGTYDIVVQNVPNFYYSKTSANGTGQQSESLWVNTETELQSVIATGSLADFFTPYPYADYLPGFLQGVVITGGTTTSIGQQLLTRLGDISDASGSPTASPDGVVNLGDFDAFAAAFGSVPGNSNWNVHADLVGPAVPFGDPNTAYSPSQFSDDLPDDAVDLNSFSALAVMWGSGNMETYYSNP
jgi:hypothetical protein